MRSTTRGNWEQVWASFDQHRQAKAGEGPNDVGDLGADGAEGEPDLFRDAAAAQAAE